MQDSLSQKQLDLITGSMLGDGSLWYNTKVPTANSCFRENHGIKQLEYLKFKHSILLPFSLKLNIRAVSKMVKINNEIHHDKSKKSKECYFATKHSKIFTELEKKWYLRDSNDNHVLNSKNNRRIKVLPPDLKLNPYIVSIWYLDDGSKQDQQGCRIATHSFTREECEFLASELKKIGITNVRVGKDKDRQLYIRSSIYENSYVDLMNMITESLPDIPECMKYKIDITNHVAPKFSCKSTTGTKGVSKRKNGKYRATARLSGVRIMKQFDTLEQATEYRQYLIKKKTIQDQTS